MATTASPYSLRPLLESGHINPEPTVFRMNPEVLKVRC
jgi:hypothetical protein